MHAIVAALNHAGFHGAMYHVNERYSRDYADGFCCDESGKPFDTDDPTIPLFRNLTALRPGDLTSRDLLILPPLLHQHSHNNEWSHAEELAIRKSGVRTVVIVTGISPPETPTALSHLDLTEGSKIPLAHSHYTHDFYNLPWDPETSLIWAPLEPRWLKAHHEFVKEGGAKATRSTPTHVLMDPDATNFGFTYPCPKHMKHTILHNLTFVELREYYEKATLLVDLSLNGHEHCPREVRSFFFYSFPFSSSSFLISFLSFFTSSPKQAVLFDCWPIISREENGGDKVDFPIPMELKVDPLDTDELLKIMIQLAITNRTMVKNVLAPFLNRVLSEPRRLLNNVARTFESRSVQFIITEEDIRDNRDDDMLWVSVLSILEAWPLASITLVLKSTEGDSSVRGNTRVVSNHAEKISTQDANWELKIKKGEARRNTFQRRWALRLRALSDRLGLTDMSGGESYHSLRIRSEAEMPVKKGIPDVIHGDFVVQWAGPVVVVDKEQAMKGFAEMISGKKKEEEESSTHNHGAGIDGLWSVSAATPSGAGCRGKNHLFCLLLY